MLEANEDTVNVEDEGRRLATPLSCLTLLRAQRPSFSLLTLAPFIDSIYVRPSSSSSERHLPMPTRDGGMCVITALPLVLPIFYIPIHPHPTTYI